MTVQHRFETHDIFNQSPAYEDVDLFMSDRALRDAVAANGVGARRCALPSSGALGRLPRCSMRRASANENTPKLKTFDYERLPPRRVEFHPAYHGFMARA
jgi:putative acyl-CoA dehydrogenase